MYTRDGRLYLTPQIADVECAKPSSFNVRKLHDENLVPVLVIRLDLVT